MSTFNKFNPADLTVDSLVSMLPLFDSYIKYPTGLKLSVADCFGLYDEEASMNLLGEHNISYMQYDCEACSYISNLPIEHVDVINRVFDDAMERDDYAMLQLPIVDVIRMYEAHPELH